MPLSQTTRNRYRTRRFSACHRHPSEPITGFCALCLRDRLSSLDSSSSSGQLDAKKDNNNKNNNNNNVVICSRRNRRNVNNYNNKNNNDIASASCSAAPVLRRSKSVVADKCQALNSLDTDPRLLPRRKSCDVRTRSTLSNLFVVDDDGMSSVMNENSGDGAPSSYLMSLGVSTIAEAVVETNKGEEDEIGILHDVIMENDIIHDDETEEEEEEEGDLKTMKEIIEMEIDNKKRNFWDAASVFSQKLRKWRQKQKEKKQSRCINGGIDNVRSKLEELEQFRDTDNRSEVEDNRFSRRSCDTEPRFSIDAHRLSVEDPRISFDAHRASWDGYMIARTIPRLTPMMSIVDNMMLGVGNKATMENLQMHSISEDGGSSGGSAQSVADSFATNRGSSSSSSTKTVGSGGDDDVKSALNARVSPANDAIFQGTKLVITEKELKDWHLRSANNINVESVLNTPNSTVKTAVLNPSNTHKTITSSRWKKVCSLWGHKHKPDDKNGDKKNAENVPETRVETGISSMNLVRNNNSLVKLRNRSSRYSTSDLDSGLLRLYLTPFRNSRRNKSGKSRAPSIVCN